MLRRNSSRNKSRRPLSRSKSTSSINRSPIRILESIDQADAERDAHIAALLSYHRAKGTHNHTKAPSVPEGRVTSLSNKLESMPSSNAHAPGRHDEVRSLHQTLEAPPDLRRQRSVRFAGPNAAPRRVLVSRASGNLRPSLGRGSDSDNVSSSERQPRSRSTTEGTGSETLTSLYIDSLHASGELYSPSNGSNSVYPSFRKLRKARSMFTPSEREGSQFYFGSDTPQRSAAPSTLSRYSPLNKENEPMSVESRKTKPPELRPSASLSVLRRRQGTPVYQSTSRAQNDLAVQLARDKFRQQVTEQKRVRSQSSMFFRLKHKRSESSIGFRKTLRDTSNDSTGRASAFSSRSISLTKQDGLKKTVRKVSSSLKSRLKGLFVKGKTKDDSETADQLGQGESDAESCMQFEQIPPIEETSMYQVPSHITSITAVPSCQQMRSRKGSFESVGMVDQQVPDDRSRVTSWTDSVTNTVFSQCAASTDRDQLSLSVIRETGPEGLAPAVRQGAHITAHGVSSTGPVVDSQRVYSALMKRAGGGRRRPSETTIRGPDRASTGDSEEGAASSTIRWVSLEDDVFDDSAISQHPATMNSDKEDSRDAEPPVTSTTGLELGAPRTLTHRSSAFFASPTCHFFRTASPYRRALRETIRESHLNNEPAQQPESGYLASLSALSLPTRRNSNSASERDKRMLSEESVYSSPGCDDPCPGAGGSNNNRPSASPRRKSFQAHGDATIFVDPPRYMSTSSHRRQTSTASSVEWKTWLSANVSKLEAPVAAPKWASGTETLNHSSALGHVREAAEIDSPTDTPRETQHNTEMATHRPPLGQVRANTSSTFAATPLKQSLQSGLLHDENEAPTKEEDVPTVQRTPSIPLRSKLRTAPSLPNFQSIEKPTPGAHSPQTLARLGCTSDQQVRSRRSRARLAGRPGSAASSPGANAAIERWALHSATASPAHAGNWNGHQSNTVSPPVSNRADNVDTQSADLNAQALGSKKMVDIFLNSRRKRAQDEGAGVMGSSPAAFL